MERGLVEPKPLERRRKQFILKLEAIAVIMMREVWVEWFG
jgi:hypothetical protein